MIKWNLRSLLAFLSTAVIWDFISKNYLKSQIWYSSLNDTSDGDFGPDWFMPKFRRSWLTAFFWWLRNHSWNYIRQFVPNWKDGEVDKNIEGKDIFITFKNTLNKTDKYGRWTRADKRKGIYGIKYIAFQIEGEVYCQWSFANKFICIQLGGGSEYRTRIKF